MNILFFGTQEGFDRFQYENISAYGITYTLCKNYNSYRGVEFHGWIVHYTADEFLRRAVRGENLHLCHIAEAYKRDLLLKPF